MPGEENGRRWQAGAPPNGESTRRINVAKLVSNSGAAIMRSSGERLTSSEIRQCHVVLPRRDVSPHLNDLTEFVLRAVDVLHVRVRQVRPTLFQLVEL